MGSETLKMNETNASAFESVYNEYSGFVQRIVARYCYNPQDHDDVYQEVFIKINRRLAGFLGKAKLSTWIYRITKNACFDQNRKHQLQHRVREQAVQEARVQKRCTMAVHLQTSHTLNAILCTMDSETRDMMLLNCFDGLTYEEIGDLYGVTRWAILKKIRRFQDSMDKRVYPSDLSWLEQDHHEEAAEENLMSC
jgi:RNA polymerase sigma-70 factor, ECF subfamily